MDINNITEIEKTRTHPPTPQDEQLQPEVINKIERLFRAQMPAQSSATTVDPVIDRIMSWCVDQIPLHKQRSILQDFRTHELRELLGRKLLMRTGGTFLVHEITPTMPAIEVVNLWASNRGSAAMISVLHSVLGEISPISCALLSEWVEEKTSVLKTLTPLNATYK